MGYSLSATGSGEGGLAAASRQALTTEAQNKRMDIASQRDIALQNAYMQFMTTKDQQAFDMAKMQAQHQYNVKLAEMNQPSWWESLGPIVGMGLAMFGGPIGAAVGGAMAYGSTYGGSGQAGLENYA
jgi:hypothetical protein